MTANARVGGLWLRNDVRPLPYKSEDDMTWKSGRGIQALEARHDGVSCARQCWAKGFAVVLIPIAGT